MYCAFCKRLRSCPTCFWLVRMRVVYCGRQDHFPFPVCCTQWWCKCNYFKLELFDFNQILVADGTLSTWACGVNQIFRILSYSTEFSGVQSIRIECSLNVIDCSLITNRLHFDYNSITNRLHAIFNSNTIIFQIKFE